MQPRHHSIVRFVILLAVLGWGEVMLIPRSLAVPDSTLTQAEAQKNVTSGLQAFDRGDLEPAITHWLAAARAFESLNLIDEEVKVLTYLGHTYQSLGEYKKSFKSLALALTLAEKSARHPHLASVMASLGALYMVIGPAEKAEHYLNKSLKMAHDASNQELSAVILNNLGNFFFMQNELRSAVDAYRKSARIATDSGKQPSLAAKAQINAAMASAAEGHDQEAASLLQAALDITHRLPDTEDKLFALLNIGLAYNDLRRHLVEQTDPLLLTASETLHEGLSVANNIGDRRGKSFILGYLGTLYEEAQRNEEALRLTRRAIFAAQQAHAPESLYRWEWQTARLLRKAKKTDEALLAYRRAVQTLETVRREMAGGYGLSRSTFRDSIRPVYFEFVDLLLRRSTMLNNHEQIESLLSEARATVELLKAAELRDYFHDDCADAARARVTKIDIVTPTAVVIYPIILSDRLELLVSLPSGLTSVAVPVKSDILIREVRQFRARLEKRTTREYLPHAQKLYDWLVRPLEPLLDSTKVDTLVFVPDGALRTIPMAALQDGEQFLIQKYAVAVTPGLDLTDPKPLKRQNVKVLAIGLTESVQGFSPLPYISTEMKALQGLYDTDLLMNQQFVAPKVEEELRNSRFNIVHIASHGQFAGDVEKTFVLTFDGKLTIDRLEQYVGLFRFRDDPLELLTLSACDTAAGDDRAALGLAGIAIKAGARSAVASLWFINDEATSSLIVEFYRQLRDPLISRAVALQRAQLALLHDRRYQHPGYWSPFLLINTWL